MSNFDIISARMTNLCNRTTEDISYMIAAKEPQRTPCQSRFNNKASVEVTNLVCRMKTVSPILLMDDSK